MGYIEIINPKVTYIGGFVLMCIVFYWQVFKIFIEGRKQANAIFKKIQTMDKEIDIEMHESNLGVNISSINITIKYTGTYRGHKFDNIYEVGGKKTSTHYTSVSGDFVLNFALDSKKEFMIIDKNPMWKSITGRDIDECFEKRFFMKGIQTRDISETLKKKLVEYQRTVSIDVQDNKLIYHLNESGLEVLPYYTAQGVVLFLEFLESIAKEIEKMD